MITIACIKMGHLFLLRAVAALMVSICWNIGARGPF
jgi:hypothetical protein